MKKLKGILGEWGFIIFIACIYSFIKMSIDSGGDFDRFYSPGEEFSFNFFIILFIHFIFAVPIWMFSKIKFTKISFYVMVAVSIYALIFLDNQVFSIAI